MSWKRSEELRTSPNVHHSLLIDEGHVSWSSYASGYAKSAFRHTTGFGSATKVSPEASVIRDDMAWHRRGQEIVDLADFTEDGDYTGSVLDAYADAFLRADAKAIDPATGKPKGIGGENPILFEEHLYNRRRREILCEQGYPDEALTQTLSKDGQMIYNRTHPQGRKVNSPSARKDHGASFFR